MKSPIKLLFICSQNRWRSLTAEEMYTGFRGYLVQSAGTEDGARIRVTDSHIRWADIVFVMNSQQVDRLRDMFGDTMDGRRVICLDIGEHLPYMSPELIAELKCKLRPHVEVPD